MEGFEFIATLWPALSGGLVMPITGWLKKKLPADLPIGTTAISLVLSTLFIMVIAWLFELTMAPKGIVVWVLTTNTFAQLIHSGKKTFDKNVIT